MQINWLEPNELAAGALPVSKADLESLKEQNIQVIVTLTEHPLTIQKEITADTLNELGLDSYHAPIVDYEAPDKNLALETVRFIRECCAEGRPVYIHCHAGVGRTGTMLHVLYMADGLSLDEAKARVKQGKPASQFLMLSDTQKAFLESLAAELGSN